LCYAHNQYHGARAGNVFLWVIRMVRKVGDCMILSQKCIVSCNVMFYGYEFNFESIISLEHD